MLIATIVMAVITFAGVIFVWFTLRDAREMGQAQVRAYLMCTGATYRVDKSWANCEVFIQNFGQSPAKSCIIRARLIMITPFVYPIGTTDIRPTNFISGVETGTGTMIPVGLGDGIPLPICWIDSGIPNAVFDAYRTSDRIFDIELDLEWVDVFDNSQSIRVRLTVSSTVAPDAATHNQRTGKMTAKVFSGDGIVEWERGGRFKIR
uniref:hypothetical protein n=1 Tax=Roseovarius sp. BRH_c41 TaxID=1629709 RepID=UPI0025DD48C2|nr:hypothetical protein [Roseovarius sp. BRH_c41]